MNTQSEILDIRASGVGLLHLDTDTVRREGYAGLAFSEDPVRHESDWSAAALVASSPRPGCELTVFADPGKAHIRMVDHVEARSAGPADIDVHAVDRARAVTTLPAAESIEASTPFLEVSGDFTVSFWGWHLELQDGGDSLVIDTGDDVHPMPGLPAETTPLRRTEVSVQAYATFHGGTFTLPASMLKSRLLVDKVTMDGTGSIQLADVVTTPAGSPDPLAATGLIVTGMFGVQLRPGTGDKIGFLVSPRGPVGALADGISMAWPSQGSGAKEFSLLLMGLIVVPSAAGAAWRMRAYWHDRRFRAACELLEVGAFEQLTLSVRPLLSSRRHGPDAAALLADAYTSQGRPRECLELLENDRLWRRTPALRIFLQARAHAQLGDRELALERLKQSLDLNPELASQAEHEPALRSLFEALPEGYT
ncbi:MAG TPA: hypothetical protein VM286_01630 [Candidatus Thermoplasmatota archaeon]|nr:hypothetical protein [Candidatus Thermoplasmatota archaeon]